MSNFDKQKKYFEMLVKVIDTPLYTTINWRVGNDFKPGKQLKVGGYLPPIDHRTIGSNEVVIELDAASYAQNAKYAKLITEYLSAQSIPYYPFWSGNKSIHIHIFLDIDLKNPDVIKTVKEAVSKGCNIYKEIRLAFTKDCLEQSGLPSTLMGIGKIVDLAKLSWNDLMGKATLIRCCGGANKKVDIDGLIVGAFKTFLPQIPSKKPRSDKQFCFDDVIFPTNIIKYSIDEHWVSLLAETFLQKHLNVHEKKEIDFKGKHLSLPCVQKLLEGVDIGKRSFGAQIISIAGRLDGLTKEETHNLLKIYVSSCPQSSSKFDFEEAKGWCQWVYNLPTPYWACGNCVKLKCCEKTDCSYHKEKYKDELAIFNCSDPLNIIKKALDTLVIGEDKLKMQLFLLYLTKNFKPEWCLMLDGPASSGKTHVMKAVAKLFGEEGVEYFVYSRITKSVLNHAVEMAELWEGKIVIIEELQGASDVVEQLRVLISEGCLNLLETVEFKEADGTKSHIASEKKISFRCLFVTCNAEEYDEGEQLLTRSWILNTDDSSSQTKNVQEAYLKEFSMDLDFFVPDLHQIRTALQFLEVPKRIVFPWANILHGLLPIDACRGRRDIKKLIAGIEASAYFHQKSRYWLPDNVLIADWRDVLVAFDYMGDSLNASSQGVGDRDLKHYEVIMNKLRYMGSDYEFDIDDVCRWLGCKYGTARNVMGHLSRAGFFENKSFPPNKSKYLATSIVPNYIEDIRNKCIDYFPVQATMLIEWLKQKNIPCEVTKVIDLLGDNQ